VAGNFSGFWVETPAVYRSSDRTFYIRHTNTGATPAVGNSGISPARPGALSPVSSVCQVKASCQCARRTGYTGPTRPRTDKDRPYPAGCWVLGRMRMWRIRSALSDPSRVPWSPRNALTPRPPSPPSHRVVLRERG
jgi:hypothetical protein